MLGEHSFSVAGVGLTKEHLFTYPLPHLYSLYFLKYLLCDAVVMSGKKKQDNSSYTIVFEEKKKVERTTTA